MTGFLGSGKTTLITKLLESPDAAGTAVLINEAGAVSIDDHLVEHVTEDVQILASGCLCCALRDDLVGAVGNVLRAAAQAGRVVERVVLETSGIADPAPIVHSAANDPRLAAQVELAGIVAVVDAARALTLLDDHPEVARQMDLADRIVLTKVDLAPEGALDALEATIAARYPGRDVVRSAHGEGAVEALLARAPALGSHHAAAGWLAPLHAQAPDLDVFTVELESPVNLDALALWHRVVTGLDGRCLLRIKGIVEAADGAWVLQSAQHAVFAPRRLAAKPAGWTGSRLVVLSRGLAADVVARMGDAAILAARGTPRRD